MYGFKHTTAEYPDKKIRIINISTKQILTFDELLNKLIPEKDKKIIDYILAHEQ